MSQVLILSAKHSLDFYEVRLNSARIPEVMNRLRKTQQLWDRYSLEPLDLHNYLVSEDEVFFSNQKVKNLLTYVIQVAFFDRYVKSNKVEKLIVADRESLDAYKTCTGQIAFSEQVTEILFEIKLSDIEGGRASVRPLTQAYMAFEKTNELNSPFSEINLMESKTIESVIRQLIDEKNARSFVQIGPSTTKYQLCRAFALEDLQFVDSIELDPMLNWFWGEMQVMNQKQVYC